jgi:hypothetical protein
MHDQSTTITPRTAFPAPTSWWQKEGMNECHTKGRPAITLAVAVISHQLCEVRPPPSPPFSSTSDVHVHVLAVSFIIGLSPLMLCRTCTFSSRPCSRISYPYHHIIISSCTLLFFSLSLLTLCSLPQRHRRRRQAIYRHRPCRKLLREIHQFSPSIFPHVA